MLRFTYRGPPFGSPVTKRVMYDEESYGRVH